MNFRHYPTSDFIIPTRELQEADMTYLTNTFNPNIIWLLSNFLLQVIRHICSIHIFLSKWFWYPVKDLLRMRCTFFFYPNDTSNHTAVATSTFGVAYAKTLVPSPQHFTFYGYK